MSSRAILSNVRLDQRPSF